MHSTLNTLSPHEVLALAILSAALRNERNAHAFYCEAAERTYRPELKRVYKTLTLFEEDHGQAIQDKIDALNMAKTPQLFNRSSIL